MNPPTLKPAIVPGKADESPAPRLPSIARKSALLYVVIVLTSFQVLVLRRGTENRRPDPENHGRNQRFDLDRTSPCSPSCRCPRIPAPVTSSEKRTNSQHPANETGVDDRWLDGPVDRRAARVGRGWNHGEEITKRRSIGKIDILATYTYAQALLHGSDDDEAKQRGMVAAIMGPKPG